MPTEKKKKASVSKLTKTGRVKTNRPSANAPVKKSKLREISITEASSSKDKVKVKTKTKDKVKSKVSPKKPKSTELVEISDKEQLTLPKISKLNKKGMRSIIGDSADDIHSLLEAGENDSATTLMHKRMVQTLIDLVPFAEHTIRKTKGARGVYQINALMSQIRELIVDIQSSQDRGQMGVLLVEKIIRPIFLDIGMMIVQEFANLAEDSKQRMSSEEWSRFREILKESRTRVAETINSKYSHAEAECRQFLQR